MRLSSRIILAAAAAVPAAAQIYPQDNGTLPISSFMTRPSSQAPFLNVTVSENGLAAGYVFIAPYRHPGAGPYIYDKFGNLVWDGFGVIGPTNTHDFGVCQYKGQPHLCCSAVNQANGYGVGQAMIIDANYTVVATVNAGRSMMPVDQHEFQLINNGASALMTSYNTIPYDLSYFGITSGLGWLIAGAFQEVDVASGEVLFEWYSSDHVNPSDTLIEPGGTDVSGDGLTRWTGFDYFHINSIDKSTATGDYLISARHTSTVYYINATDQSIIWRLSSAGNSDFSCVGFNFTFQHDARLRSENDTNTVISLFDNASNAYNRSASESSGLFINIDHMNKVATLSSRTTANFIEGGILSDSQGNTQLLYNNNVFHGWGSRAWASELNPNGDTVWAAHFADPYMITAMSYRAFSFEWQSTPANTVPQVYAYAQNDKSSTYIYVSWNGATTVNHWRFYGADKIGDDFEVIGSTAHRGFETEWVASGFHKWVMVEAVSWQGDSLRNSSYQPTFVPTGALVAVCHATGCDHPVVPTASSS